MGNCGSMPQTLEEDETTVDKRIQVVVVLCLKNRSFDHMLGFMKKINPAVDGLTGEECCRLSLDDPAASTVKVRLKANYVDSLEVEPTYDRVKNQLYGWDLPTKVTMPLMDGFAHVAEARHKGLSKTIMSAFDSDQVPVLKALATEFAVFDRWYSSVPAPSLPNRLFIHSATSAGLISNEEVVGIPGGVPQRTIFESLEENKNSFGIYYQSIPCTLAFKNLRQAKYASCFKAFSQFKTDAARGMLPNYSFIEPRYFGTFSAPQNDDQPSADVREGQKLIKEVYEALRKSPQWYQTALLITYDEHGSYYDHVAPPGGTTIPSPDQKQASSSDKFNFDRLGVRVPTILVSPWINKNTVIHEPHPLMGHGPTSQYEHSSIAASLKRIFGLPEYLTERDAWAASFDRLLTERRTPREDCPADIFFPPEVLSAPPTLTSALPKSPRTSGVPISHEQHLILQLAASLNNDFSAQIKNLKVWNTHTAQEFIDRNVKTFFQKLRMSQSDLNNT